MSSSSRPFATLEPEFAPISAEPKYRAYILIFVYLGVDAIDASEERKAEKLDMYAAAAHELLLVNHRVRIRTLDIRKYYTQVRFQAEIKSRRWDILLIGTIIAQHVKEKKVFDAIITFKPVSIRAFQLLPPFAESSIKEGNVSEDTQKLVAEVTGTSGRVAATNLMRDIWTRRIDDGERPTFRILDPDLQQYPRAILSFGASLASHFNEEAARILTDSSKHTP